MLADCGHNISHSAKKPIEQTTAERASNKYIQGKPASLVLVDAAVFLTVTAQDSRGGGVVIQRREEATVERMHNSPPCTPKGHCKLHRRPAALPASTHSGSAVAGGWHRGLSTREPHGGYIVLVVQLALPVVRWWHKDSTCLAGKRAPSRANNDWHWAASLGAETCTIPAADGAILDDDD